MDTNFNTVIYQLEMLSLVNTAIKKLKAEHPDYEVFTMSLTTDFASGVSAVHFDSRASSERYLKKEAEQYQKYLQAGNLSMAEMYAPTTTRNCSINCLVSTRNCSSTMPGAGNPAPLRTLRHTNQKTRALSPGRSCSTHTHLKRQGWSSRRWPMHWRWNW